MGEIARIGIYGDAHLCDHDYGAHTDYPKESLEYFHKVTEIVSRRNLTHLIGTGDFTFGKFTSLDYRVKVEEELSIRNKVTNGNYYELKGNHDSATNGMTEYEYYVLKGMLKESKNISIGNLNITMLDYLRSGKYTREQMNISEDPNSINIVIAHQYFKFSDSLIPNFVGNAIMLDDFEPLFGTDYLICGHIHHILGFRGNIVRGNFAHETYVQYLGCMMRPSYKKGTLDTKGNVTILTLYDDGHIDYDVEQVELWDIQDSFNISKKEKEQAKKQEKEDRVDISDIVSQLNSHNRSIGDPENIIESMENVEAKYKNKALQLLRDAE